MLMLISAHRETIQFVTPLRKYGEQSEKLEGSREDFPVIPAVTGIPENSLDTGVRLYGA